MDIKNRKNKDLIFKFIELSDLVSGRNIVEKKSWNFGSELNKVTDSCKSILNDINMINNNIEEINFKLVEKPVQLRNEIKYFENINSLKKLIDMDSGGNWWKLSEIDSFIYTTSIQKDEYLKIKCYIKDYLNNTRKDMEEILEDVNKGIDYNEKTKRLNKMYYLSRIVCLKDNENIIEKYEKLIAEIINYLNEYDYKSELRKELSIRENELYKKKQELLPYIDTYFEEVDKTLIEQDDFEIQLDTIKEKKINLCYDMISNITKDIENNFVSLIPKKYVFNEEFLSYAIECLFYERCSSIGELLNLYENFELHTQTNRAINHVIKSLNNFQLTQFHQLMELNDSITNELNKIQAGQAYQAMELSSINMGINLLSSEVRDLSSDVRDVAYTHERIGRDMIESQDKLIEINNMVNMQIESSNVLAKQQLNTLTDIDSQSRKIAKKIYDVKAFTDRYSNAKAMEGKPHY
ncbi:hypothetical protein [Clostridium celatum]|uniref:hypothetical protein n=1 Tax=Clostridium celatum TaxID=36834 RepID=UPI0018972E1E|nr:hypothetical protein [Clostridium celatum]